MMWHIPAQQHADHENAAFFHKITAANISFFRNIYFFHNISLFYKNFASKHITNANDPCHGLATTYSTNKYLGIFALRKNKNIIRNSFYFIKMKNLTSFRKYAFLLSFIRSMMQTCEHSRHEMLRQQLLQHQLSKNINYRMRRRDKCAINILPFIRKYEVEG